MASKCGRFMNKSSFNSIRSTINSNLKSNSFEGFKTANSNFKSVPIRRFSLSRTPSELGCAMSLLPLHSAVSSARMTSCLSTSSCRSLSQGTLCRTYPGL